VTVPARTRLLFRFVAVVVMSLCLRLRVVVMVDEGLLFVDVQICLEY